METKVNAPISEEQINHLIEQTRTSFSRMLIAYLKLYEDYDHAKKEEKPSKHRYHNSDPYFDRKGKVNWEIIRKFLPFDLERSIKEKFGFLGENEIRLCILLFFKLSEKTISAILPLQPQSIDPTRGRIKSKIGGKSINEIFVQIAQNLALIPEG